jgi:hypothetical protein
MLAVVVCGVCRYAYCVVHMYSTYIQLQYVYSHSGYSYCGMLDGRWKVSPSMEEVVGQPCGAMEVQIPDHRGTAMFRYGRSVETKTHQQPSTASDWRRRVKVGH